MTTTLTDPYARMAREWWSEHHRDEIEELPDPEAFFSATSIQVRAAIEATQADLQAHLPETDSYLERVAAIRRTQLIAEEVVLAEWFPTDPATRGAGTVA